jgi:hypothetical protein
MGNGPLIYDLSDHERLDLLVDYTIATLNTDETIWDWFKREYGLTGVTLRQRCEKSDTYSIQADSSEELVMYRMSTP